MIERLNGTFPAAGTERRQTAPETGTFGDLLRHRLESIGVEAQEGGVALSKHAQQRA